MACGTADSHIWEILEYGNCSFKAKSETINFCRNPDNVTGVCDRKSCPLANSKYATVRLVKGTIILQMKTAERAHMPNRLWEKIELPEDAEAAQKIIAEQLMYWDEWLIDKVKFRYTRLLEVLENMRRMRQEADKVKVVPIKKRVEKRNRSREARALNVAHVELTVKEELKRKMKAGEYGEVYNIDQTTFDDVLDDVEQPQEFVDESDFEEYVDEEEELVEAQ